MRLDRACVPLGFAWSSPFARWQGPLAEVNSIDLAVDVTGRALEPFPTVTDNVAWPVLPALSANVTVIVKKPGFGNVSWTVCPLAPGSPGEDQANDAGLIPEPPSSATLRV